MRRMRAAGAAVMVCLALGGTLTSAQNASGPPAPSVAVTGEAYVTGTETMEVGSDPTSIETVGNVVQIRGGVLTDRTTMDDPRVSGAGTWVINMDIYETTKIEWGLYRLENSGGAWEGMCSGSSWAGGEYAMDSCWLVGSGGYEGWSYFRSYRWTPTGILLEGVIVPGSPPPISSASVAPSASPASSAAPSPSALATIGEPADDGARIVKIDTIDVRTRDLTIESPSVGTVQVRLLLPSTFAAQPTTRWPVLYLLQGCCDVYSSWTRETDVEALTAPTDLLVVMPAATSHGIDGWYTDWFNAGEGGPPKWETFHLTELRQLLERNWEAGDNRVVAGLSMGGYGAVNYAARHPDMFKAAASYSGVLDLKVKPDDFSDFEAITRWGDPVADAANWDDHDPIKLVPSLKGMPLYIAYGNGEPGPLDPSGAERDGLEEWIGQGGDLFVAALKDAGIPATVNAYGAGTHTWPYWQRELHASLPMLLAALAESAGSPSGSPAP